MTMVRDTDAPDAPGAPGPSGRPHAPVATPWQAPARPAWLVRLRTAALRAGRGGRDGRDGRDDASRGRGDRLDLRNTWQVVAGSILVPLGVVLILMAWYGSAHTHYVQQQIPYLVSGSFAGLGCMVLGGLLYWAHWLYRLYDQADLHHEEHLQALQQTIAAMADRIGRAETGATVTAGDGADRDERPAAELDGAGAHAVPVVRTAEGRYYHDPSCPVVAHHGVTGRPLSPGDAAGLEPCRICRPPADLPR